MRLKRREDKKSRERSKICSGSSASSTRRRPISNAKYKEEDRTGIRDQSHIQYSTFAKAAAERRDNLRQSAEWLREKLVAAVRDGNDPTEQFSRAAQQAERRDVSLK